MRMYGRPDPEELKDAAIDRGTLRRAWSFARAYRAALIAYLGVIILGAVVGALPPLVLKQLIDKAIPEKNHTLLYVLVAIAAGGGLPPTMVGPLQPRGSAPPGGGPLFLFRGQPVRARARPPVPFFSPPPNR